MPERVGSPKFQFVCSHHPPWDREQPGYSRHGAEEYHGHFSRLAHDRFFILATIISASLRLSATLEWTAGEFLMSSRLRRPLV
jgi:hypothetical protein